MNLNEKSRGVSFLLTLLFGPLGLLYSSVTAGVILCVIAILSASSVVGPVICWVLAIAIGDHCAYKHNQSVKEFKSLMAAKGDSSG